MEIKDNDLISVKNDNNREKELIEFDSPLK
jgi:hypothetical protein